MLQVEVIKICRELFLHESPIYFFSFLLMGALALFLVMPQAKLMCPDLAMCFQAHMCLLTIGAWRRRQALLLPIVVGRSIGIAGCKVAAKIQCAQDTHFALRLILVRVFVIWLARYLFFGIKIYVTVENTYLPEYDRRGLRSYSHQWRQ